MTTVVQVVQHLRPGGIETMALALDLNRFAKPGEKGLILSLEGDLTSAVKAWPRLQPYEEQLIFMNKPSGLKPGLIKKLSRLFKELQVEAVHTHHIGPLLYGGLAAKLAGVKYLIHTEHDAWHLNNGRRRTLQRAVLALTHPTLVADAQTVAEAMEKHLKRSDILVIHNGIDTTRFRPGDRQQARQALGLPPKVQLIGCSGRLEAVKDQATLIKALTSMPLNTHLAIAGSGSKEAELKELSKKLLLEERVHFLGQVEAMPTFYQSLDIFCLPSRQEGLPLAPLEAQSCGIPTAVTDVGGARETLCPQTGVLLLPGASGAMAATLTGMLKRPREHSPRKFIQQYRDVQQMAEAYARLRTDDADKGAIHV